MPLVVGPVTWTVGCRLQLFTETGGRCGEEGMPYRHPRGSSGEDLSDEDMDWPHLRLPSAAGSQVNHHLLVGHMTGVGDVHGSAADDGRGLRHAPGQALGGAGRPPAPLAVEDSNAADAAYAQDVHEAVAAMNDSCSSSSSSLSTSSSSLDSSTSSRSSCLSSAGGVPEQQDVSGGPGAPRLEDVELPPPLEPLPLSCVEQLFAFLILRGQTTVTQAAYRIVQRFFNAKMTALAGVVRRDLRLPSLEAVRTTIAPRIRRAWALSVRHVPVPADEHVEPVKVGVILPSEHVKRDFAFRETFDLFFLAGGRSREERKWHPEFCDSTMHRSRHEVLKDGAVLRAFVVGGVRLRSGDTVTLELADGAVLQQVVVGAGGFAGREAGVQDDDAVHAGDFTLPCTRYGVPFGVLNARHWLPEKHGHITWHPYGLPVMHVTRIVLELSPPPPPLDSEAGCEGLPGRVYVGPDGHPTFKLGLALFMDDFAVRQGRSSSAGGVYLLYLSWSFRHRASRNAVRPISLAPPGVDSDSILQAVSDDLVEGATSGWLVKDPDGLPIRVMADLALYMGDYKQVSKTSHMLGHMADAPCPLCTFIKSRGEGARYTGPDTSQSVSHVRTTGRTLSVVAAVRDLLESEGGPSGAPVSVDDPYCNDSSE